MAGRRTNLALLVLLALAFATGGVAYGIGTGWGRAVAVLHAVVALAMIALLPWKSVVARRGLRRRGRSSWGSVGLGFLIVLSIVSGMLHSTGVATTIGPLTAMQIHVGSALLAIPFALWHILSRRVRVHRTDLSRRSLLRAGAVLGAGALVTGGIELSARVASLPGARRRFTGSHETGSFEPESMPVTQWLGDRVPLIDPSSWSLEVTAGDHRRSWSYEEVARFDEPLVAVLDCTGGWFAGQEWRGAPLQMVLPGEVKGRSIRVESVTGYVRRFPLRDVNRLFLATRAGGETLNPGHGFPLRLVAPGRRGFWWVKWIRSIRVDAVPWWWQPPFPLD